MADHSLVDKEPYRKFLVQYAKDLKEIDAPMIAGAIERCIARLDAQSTVDAVEVVHASKAESAISKTGLMCTACYSDIDRDAVFCKFCGAKMDGERRDNHEG